MIGVAMPGGRSLVYRTDGAGLLRRGRGRGVVLRSLSPWHRAKAVDLVTAVDAVEVRDDWTDAPRAIASLIIVQVAPAQRHTYMKSPFDHRRLQVRLTLLRLPYKLAGELTGGTIDLAHGTTDKERTCRATPMFSDCSMSS